MPHFCKKPVDFRDPNFGIAGSGMSPQPFRLLVAGMKANKNHMLATTSHSLGTKWRLGWSFARRLEEPAQMRVVPSLSQFQSVWATFSRFLQCLDEVDICSCSTMQIIKNEVLSFFNQCNCWSWETMLRPQCRRLLCWMPFDLSSSPAGFSPCSTAFAACMHGPESYCIPLPQIIGHVYIIIYVYISQYMYIIIYVYIYIS